MLQEMINEMCLSQETVVWVIVARNRAGKPRGFEKSTERFYLLESEAQQAHAEMELREFFSVVEARIGYPS